jgi:hypothetical protein
MYTGTLIRDLLTVVERAEQRARRKQDAEERELQALFASQISLMQDEPIFAGAA